MKKIQGFTLVEIIIVMAIISMLVALTIPAYQNYARSSSEKACLQETKAYANYAFLALNDQDDATHPSTPVSSACTNITDASTWTSGTADKTILGIPKFNGAKKTQCDLNISPSCTLVP
jgi:type IV pilus assembly protein PilA